MPQRHPSREPLSTTNQPAALNQAESVWAADDCRGRAWCPATFAAEGALCVRQGVRNRPRGDRLEARRQRLLERQLPELDEGEPQFYEARAP